MTMQPVDVRSQLVDALRLDLVGPENGTELEAEVLPQAPSRWYLTGFLTAHALSLSSWSITESQAQTSCVILGLDRTTANSEWRARVARLSARPLAASRTHQDFH
jgi:hypothetical protein